MASTSFHGVSAAREYLLDGQARALINLQQQYDAWIEAEQVLHSLPYNLVRKEVKGHVYLYEVFDRQNNAKSLGPWSDAGQTQLKEYRVAKRAAKERRDGARVQLDVTSRIYRALRLPMIDGAAGKILREADRLCLLGTQMMVVGTNAIPAYSIEANAFIRAVPDETLDLDIAWTAEKPLTSGRPIWEMHNAVDPTFTVNTEQAFLARSAGACEVEVLAAPSRIRLMAHALQPRRVDLPEQKWLLNGRAVNHVVVGRDGKPARIVAPDPRWFALHKLWMSDKPQRSQLSKGRDRKQGIALLETIVRNMPHYPMDDEFRHILPPDLLLYLDRWAAPR